MDAYTQKLIETFQKAGKDQKLDLLREISRDKSDDVLAFLINTFSDEHWIVRKTAAEYIQGFQSDAISALSAALSSYSEDIQHWSLQVLTKLGQKAIPSILRAVKSTNQDVRFFACAALGEVREPLGVAALVKALGDDKWPVRKAASDALVKYGETVIPQIEQIMNRTDDEDIRFWAIKTLGKLGPKAQRILLETLKSGDKHLRYVVAAALGESGDKRVIKVLLESLGDPDWTIRKSATQALAEIGENAIGMMIEALKDPNEDVRDGCLIALVKTGDKAMQRLFEYIMDIDENQRYLIRKTLVKLGPKVVDPLIKLFKHEKPEILSFAAATLGEIGSPKAVPVLIDGLSHQSWHVRRSSAYALTEIGEKGVDRIAEALTSSNDDVRYWVTRILESIGEPGMPYLVRALKDKNKSIRFFSAKALRASNDPEVLRALIAALVDESWSVRNAASSSIASIENISIETLLRNMVNDNEDIRFWISQIVEKIGLRYIDRIHECLRTNDPELRLSACQALGMIGSPESIDFLIEALRDENEWVRIYAAISLGKSGDARAIIPLIRGLSDRNAEVHRNIAKAFKHLGKQVFSELSRCIECDEKLLRRNSAIAIGELREERGLDLLIILMEDPEPKVRQSAAEALGKFPGLKAHTILVQALEDKELTVRTAVSAAIAEHGKPEGIRTLIEHLQKCKEEREMRVVSRNLSAMAQKVPNEFIALFADPQASIRTVAAEALAGAGMCVLQVVSEVAANKETDETTAFWCAKVIKKIRDPRENLSDG